jgi:hypothetical protein
MLEQMLNCFTVVALMVMFLACLDSLQNMSCKLRHRDIILIRPELESRGLRPITCYLKNRYVLKNTVSTLEQCDVQFIYLLGLGQHLF